jgi:hypothetical protein
LADKHDKNKQMQKNIKKIIFIGILSALFFSPFVSHAELSVVTDAADNINDVSATLRGISGTGLDLSLPTTAYFRYTTAPTRPVFCNDIYGSNMISTPDIKITSSSQSFHQNIVDLNPGTPYYYCAIISNKNQIAYSDEVKEFITSPSSLFAQTTVTTIGSQVIDSSSAWLKGTYSTSKPIQTYFEYREEPTFLSLEPTKIAWLKATNSEKNHATNTLGDVNFLLTGLKANTKYDFRFIAKTNETPPQIFGDNTFLSFKTFAGAGSESHGMTFDAILKPIIIATGGTDNIVIPSTGTGGAGTGTGGAGGAIVTGGGTLGQIMTPPADAVVRFQEGIEDVFFRQIIANNGSLARIYGYKDGRNLTAFAWDLADLFARAFGYIGYDGKEIRVGPPDLAAYQIVSIGGGKLIVYEYFDSKIVSIRNMTEILRNIYDYEYYFRK